MQGLQGRCAWHFLSGQVARSVIVLFLIPIFVHVCVYMCL